MLFDYPVQVLDRTRHLSVSGDTYLLACMAQHIFLGHFQQRPFLYNHVFTTQKSICIFLFFLGRWTRQGWDGRQAGYSKADDEHSQDRLCDSGQIFFQMGVLGYCFYG